MPDMMKAAIYYNNQDIRVEERPIPQIGDGDLLVKTIASGLCGGEAMEWRQIKHAPKVMGHEPAGVVVDVGKDVSGFEVGDRVFVNHHVARLQDHRSLRGHFTREPLYGKTELDPGTMCEYFRAPAQNIQTDAHVIPENVSFAKATVLEPWGCVIGGLKVAGIQPGDTVAVVGCGFMGQGFVHMAPLFGAGQVIALDFSEYRLEKAKIMGATTTINPKTEDGVEAIRELTDGNLADVVIVTVPNVKAWEQGYSLVGVGGTIHFNAPPPGSQTWSINPERLYFDEITITTKYSADHTDTYQVLRWLASERINPDPVLTHHFELDGIGEAFELLLKADQSLKSVIYPHGIVE